jgi:transposase
LESWRRGKAVLGYIDGRRVIELAAELDVTRGAINRWLQWYEAEGVDGLVTGKPPGAAPRLTDFQRDLLCALIEIGPQAGGYTSGVWTGPMIADLIEQRFGVRYHNHHIPRLLNQLGTAAPGSTPSRLTIGPLGIDHGLEAVAAVATVAMEEGLAVLVLEVPDTVAVRVAEDAVVAGPAVVVPAIEEFGAVARLAVVGDATSRRRRHEGAQHGAGQKGLEGSL